MLAKIKHFIEQIKQSMTKPDKKAKKPSQKQVAKKQEKPVSQKVMHVGSQTRYLAHSLVLEEAGPPRITAISLIVISALVFFAILWAGLTRINETAVTEGQVITAESVHNVQHLEGGIIGKIHVKDGDMVNIDQVLVSLAPQATLAELEQSKARQTALRLRAARLRSFAISGEDVGLSSVTRDNQLLEDQIAILKLQQEAKDKQEQVLHTRKIQRNAERAVLKEQEKTLREQIAFVEEELKMQGDLLSKGLISKVVFLQTKREISSLKGQLAEIQGNIARATAAIAEAETALLELDARLRNEALEEMGEISAELAQINEAIKKLTDKTERLEIRSPVKGVVKGLEVNTVGTVITPGQKLMEIVPTEGSIVVETKIQPKDIGNISPGQDVTIKVTSYDFARFGSLDGILEKVSATTFTDEEGNFFYKGIIHLEKNYVGPDPSKNVILPGMIVQADIIVGSKTLLQYLLKPIYRSLQSSFREK